MDKDWRDWRIGCWEDAGALEVDGIKMMCCCSLLAEAELRRLCCA